MNKSDVVEIISQKVGVSKTDTDKVIMAFFNLAAETVSDGEKLTIPGWISFEQVHRSAREGRNPSTGEILQIPARKAVKVSAGAKLKKAAQG